MALKLNIKEFLKEALNSTLIDVRSPSEFHHGHIPGAKNLPLFSDAERKIIGTLYTKKGKEISIQKGFEILAGKYSQLIEKIHSLSSDGVSYLYCWRGGMRSGAMSWLFERLDIKTYLLDDGYKSYRRLIRTYFSSPLHLIIVGGMTGTGKTEILEELQSRGFQVINLEKIAGHKGSAFGSLGEKQQPTTEQFENNLLVEFLKYDKAQPIFLENESQSIGRVFIPPELYQQMKEAKLFNLEIPIDERIDRLVKAYSCYEDAQLMDCLHKIEKKIGGQNFKEAAFALKKKDYQKFARIALQYYDKSYRFGLEKKPRNNLIPIHSDTGNAKINADLIKKFL
ncbi:MAG: tRNA 2-selenouridine(34) synthase MnmH [Bacteroidota bacterium]